MSSSNGVIPAGKSCPFRERCAFLGDDCPSPTNKKKVGHACHTARAWEIISGGSDNLLIRSIISRRPTIRPIPEDQR